MYPRNAANPERVSIGAVVQISNGAVQTSGVAVKVIPFGAAEASGGGTVAYSADGAVLYTPTQAETNYTSFILVAVKTGCVPAVLTVVTTASSTAGKTVVASLDNGAITAAAIAADAITDAKVASDVTIASVTGSVASVTAAVTVGTINANVVNASSLAADAVAEIQSGLATQTSVDDLPTNAELATALASAGDATLTAIAAEAVKTAAIKAKTDNLPSDPADASDIAASFSTVNGTLATLATAANLATVAGYLDTEVAAILAIANKLDTMLELDGAVYRLTVNALEQAPSGGGGGSTDWTPDQRTAIAAILGIPASGTTPEVPSAGALKVIDDLIDTEVGSIVSTLATISGLIDTEVAAIKAKTDGLPADTAASLTAIQGYVDTLETEVAKIVKSGESRTYARSGETSITFTETRA